MRIIHITHTNGYEAVILTDLPPEHSADKIVASHVYSISNYNSITEYTIIDAHLTEWPLPPPTEQCLFPSFRPLT